MVSRVRGEGPRSARLVVVGEAPGAREEGQGRPFVGPSGQLLERWWAQVGFRRADVRIENVVERRPPGNKISAIPAEELRWWVDQLHERIAALDDPWVIVPMGETALYALTGKKGITKWRGSVLGTVDRKGRKLKVIPTRHPAATFREPTLEKRCVRDWQRIAGDLGFRDLRLPVREHYTRPAVKAVEEFVAYCREHANLLSVDIETPGGIVACVGFAPSPKWSWTIPTVPAYWGDNQTTSYIWTLVRQLCELPCEKVTQNGLFDGYYLQKLHRIGFTNWRWDTLELHHGLDAAEDHDLAYMASVDTRQPFWKDEAKDPESVAKYASDMDALWTYNGIDCCVTWELADKYIAETGQRGRLDYYHERYGALRPALLRLMLHGIKMDDLARRRALAKLIAERIGVEERLRELAGGPLHVTNGISPPKLLAVMRAMGVKPPRVRGDDGAFRETTNEVGLKRLVRRYPKFAPIALGVIEHRKTRRQAEFLADSRVDEDGRMRSSYKKTTETGRLASSKNPMGTGGNAQNVDRKLRHLFLPDEGCVFVEVDLSQAESRIVSMLTGDSGMIRLARMSPAEFDVHRYNAAIIFGVAEAEITKEQRYLGKRAVHASNYGMRGETLSDQLVKEGYVFTGGECERMIGRYLERFPAILDWQAATRATLLRDRRIENSWGGFLSFALDRLDDEAYRRGYAFVPQSEVAELVNEWGFKPLDQEIVDGQFRGRARINAHIHDALLVSARPEAVFGVIEFLVGSLSRPRVYAGNALAMPCEIKLGRTWKGEIGWKQMPSRNEVESALTMLTSGG